MTADRQEGRGVGAGARMTPFAGLVAGALVAAIFGAACGAPAQQGGETTSGPRPNVGDSAPDFALQAADGSEVTLQDVTAGRPALFYFSMGPG